ncbi:MAG: glycosyltransferase family 2 protein [Deltaproteobacteria bacterium]|jgi:glycosyltransferase involved in cell wall biosynthesis|nr:glycosyltransferase family 2 protein [Deltaproteobacteria bacterium]
MPECLVDVLVLTRNEAGNIVPCLESARTLGDCLGELIVIDDFSDDQTVLLAGSAGARAVQRALDDFASQRNFALGQARSDWVFFLDADERLSPGLARAVRDVVSRSPAAAGRLQRRSTAFGRKMRFGPLAPDWVVRLFPRTQVRWTGLVHEMPVHSLPEIRLAGWLEHHTYGSWEKYLAKWQLYAAMWAREAHRTGRRGSLGKGVLRAGAAFAKMFLGKLGILGGPLVWALCWYYSGYTLSKYLLLSELDNTRPESPPESPPEFPPEFPPESPPEFPPEKPPDG